MAAICHLGFPTNLKFQNLADFWVCTESGYQIWHGYLKLFTSYRHRYQQVSPQKSCPVIQDMVSVTPREAQGSKGTMLYCLHTLRFLSFSDTPHIHLTITSSVPSSPDIADLQPSSPRFQSHISMHSGHKPCISFPLCGMMHRWAVRIGDNSLNLA